MAQSGYKFEKCIMKAQQELLEEKHVNAITSSKQKQATLIFLAFIGLGDLHEFYVENIKKGIIKLFTADWFGAIYDIIQINNSNFKDSKVGYLKI